MFKTALTARTTTHTASGTAPLRAASPFGGNYVAVFDGTQAPAEVSGGHYTASFEGPAGNRPARPIDSYVAGFTTPGHPALNRRGCYVDTER